MQRFRNNPSHDRALCRPVLCGIAAVGMLLVQAGRGVPNANGQSASTETALPSRAPNAGVAATLQTKSNPLNSPSTPESSPRAEALAVRLELELPPGCGSVATFVDRVHARLDRVQFVEQGANRVVEARIVSKADSSYRATMTMRYSDGRSSSRNIDASDCSDAIDALALVTAVTLDPLGVSFEAPAAAGPNPSSASAATSSHPQPPKEPRKAMPATASSGAVSKVQRPELPAQHRTLVGVGLSYVAFRGPSPGWLHGIEFGVRIQHGSASAFAPSLRLGTSYSLRRSVVAEGGTADFALASALLELCPWRGLLPAAELRGCGLAHFGVMRADGRSTDQPESHRRPYLALGATAELVLLPSRQLAIPLRLHATFPTSRDTYAFDPTAFYQVSPVAFGFSAGLEMRFR